VLRRDLDQAGDIAGRGHGGPRSSEEAALCRKTTGDPSARQLFFHDLKRLC